MLSASLPWIFAVTAFVIRWEVTFSDTSPNGLRFIVEPPGRLEFSNSTGGKVECHAQGVPSPTITWTLLDGSPVANISGLRQSSSDGSLVFSQFRPEQFRPDVHTVGYRCMATNPAGSLVSRDTQVKAVLTVDYDVHVYDAFSIRGNTAVFKCHIPTFLEAYVSVAAWIRDDTLKIVANLETDGKFWVSPNGDLFIKDVTSVDKGSSYRCQTYHRLTQTRKTSSRSGQLIVTDPRGNVPPKIIESGSVVDVVKDSVIFLSCVAQGFPAPSTVWMRRSDTGETRVISNGRVKISSHGLLISASQETDVGVYVCQVNSSTWTTTKEFSVNVLVPLHVRVEPSKQTLDVGQPLSLNCQVKGHPISSMTWMKDGQHVPSEHIEYFEDQQISTLKIHSIRTEDKGMYQCFTQNERNVIHGTAQVILGDFLPEFKNTFETLVKDQGAPFTLHCTVTGNPVPTVTWSLDTIPLETTGHVSIKDELDTNGGIRSTLHVRRAKAEDGGLYSCEASNRLGKSRHFARVNVHGPLEARNVPPITAVAGANLMISCPVYGYPIDSVEWKKGRFSLPSTVRQEVFSNGTLLIVKVQRNVDNGDYLCTASNRKGEKVQTKVQLAVLVAPKIVPFSFGGDHFFAGVLARVSCVVYQGDLPLTIKWLKDGARVLPESGILIHSMDDFTSVLTIDNIQSEHSGNYTCVARNAAAAASHTAQLVVTVPPRWIRFPEQVVSVVLHQNLYLHCEAEGFPTPKVTWMKGESDIINGPAMTVYLNGTLLINYVEEEQEGYYVCKASNGIGEGLDQIVHLKVYDPPSIINNPSTITVKLEGNAALSCVAKGDEPLNITWLMDGKLLSSQFHKRYNLLDNLASSGLTSELSIKNVEKQDGSIFTCWAQNAYGEDRADFTLLVQSQPDPPTVLSATDIGNQTARLSWNAPFDGNEGILNYILEVKQKGGTPQNRTLRGEQLFETISGLKPSATYWFRMFARNSIGLSGGSEPVELTITGEVPSGTPSNVNVQALDSQTVKVSWQPPPKDTWNGDIRGYYVGYRHASSSDPYNFQLLEVPTGYDKGLSFTIPALQEFTKYSIAIQAFNDIGKGPLSNEILVMTNEDVPTKPPTDVRCSAQSSNKIAVSWQQPAASSINGILRGHRVLYWPVDTWDGKHVRLVNSTLSTAFLEDLEPFTNHSIQIVAYTLAGDGVPSKPIYCRTWEDVPGSPSDVKCTSASTESVAIYWLPPQNSNGHITHYTIYIEDPSNGKQTSNKVLGHFSHYEVKDLKRSLRYKLWVTASSVLGEGRASQPVFGGPAASFVAAKCITFGRVFKVVQGAKLVLPCPTVGIPSAVSTWMRGKQELSIENRLQLLPENSMQITKVQSTDAGNYTCKVKNDFGDDAVHHSIIVQVPPAPPTVSVIMATFNSVGLRWKVKANGDSPILGYLLRFKPEFGSWDSVELQPYQESHTLRNLRCGTSYEMTISAVNDVGKGQASEILAVSTDGGAPVAPQMAKLIEESTNHMTLHLDSWVTNGCPILYFTVEYQARRTDGWTLVTKGLKPNQRMQIVPDLVPGTWYTLRMTAHSTAGTTVQEYDFSTLMQDRGGDFNLDDFKEITSVFSVMDLSIIAPIIACGLVIVICLVVTCFWVRRRRRQQDAHCKLRNSTAESSLPRPRHNEANRSTLTSLRRSAGSGGGDGADSDDDISPYAMVRLSDIQHGTSKSAGNANVASLPRQAPGWHQSHQVVSVPFHHAPTAPPMSETYGSGGAYPTGMMSAAFKGNPQLQAYSQPHKDGKKKSTGSLPLKFQEQPSKSAETTFVFPPPTDGDYDPPPEFKWPFSKQ